MSYNNFYGHKNYKVSFQPNIGLDATVRQSVKVMRKIKNGNKVICRKSIL